MLAAGALAVSCADYNETNNFTAEPDPSVVVPYSDLNPVKTYIDRNNYPNMSIGATLKANEFNRQELAVAFTVFAGVVVLHRQGEPDFLGTVLVVKHGGILGQPTCGLKVIPKIHRFFLLVLLFTA